MAEKARLSSWAITKGLVRLLTTNLVRFSHSEDENPKCGYELQEDG